MQDNMFYAQLITINRHHVVVCTLIHCELYNGADIYLGQIDFQCFRMYIHYNTAAFPCQHSHYKCL